MGSANNIHTSTKFTDYPVVMLSMTRLDDMSSASISIAKEIGKQQKIFYVEHPYTLKDIIKQRNQLNIKRWWRIFLGKERSVRKHEVYKDIYHVIPFATLPFNKFPKGPVYNFLQKINDLIVCLAVKKALKRHKVKSFILYNSFNPFYGDRIKSTLKPVLTIYQCRDDISVAPVVSKHGTYLEEEKAKNADLVIATSHELVRKLSGFNKNVHFLPNAADYDLFIKSTMPQTEMPEELRQIKKPVIGYMGLIGTRMDVELVKKISASFPDYTLLMIGVVIKSFEGMFDDCENITILGPRPYNSLPGYLKYFDVPIIPFENSKLTKSIYPLKINEYLCSGKPIVTTNFSEDISFFKDLVYVAESHDTFIENIRKAVKEDDKAIYNKRIETARKNTWNSRLKNIESLFEQCMRT